MWEETWHVYTRFGPGSCPIRHTGSIRNQVLYPAELRARPRGKSSCCKGFPASTTTPRNPFFTPKKALVCTGFAVCTVSPSEITSSNWVINRGQVTHASQFLASRPVFMKKETPAESRNPFKNCDGAEGGTRTPTGFPTTTKAQAAL